MRKISRQQSVGKRDINIQRVVVKYHQRVLSELVRFYIDKYLIPPHIEIYLRNLWILFLSRNYFQLSSSTISKATAKEHFDICSSVALLLVALREFSIPISEAIIFKIAALFFKEFSLSHLFDSFSLPPFLKSSLTALDYSLCVKKSSQYRHTLLGRPPTISKAIRTTLAWNTFIGSDLADMHRFVSLLNNHDIDRLFWLLLNMKIQFFREGMRFWSSQMSFKANSSLRYIKTYPSHCEHYIDPYVRWLCASLNISLDNNIKLRPD